MKDRINNILQKYNMTSSDFADKIGVGKSNISHILGGRNNPSLEIVKRILQEFPEINSEWLLFGTGAITKEKESKKEVQPIISKQNTNPQLEFKEDDINETEIVEPDPLITEIITVDGTNLQMKSTTNNEDTNQAKETKPEIHNTSKVVTRIVLYYSDNTYQQFDPNSLPL